MVSVQPGFWENPKEAEAILQEIRNKKIWTNSFSAVQSGLDDLEILYEFYELGEADEKEIEKEFMVLQGLHCLKLIQQISN